MSWHQSSPKGESIPQRDGQLFTFLRACLIEAGSARHPIHVLGYLLSYCSFCTRFLHSYVTSLSRLFAFLVPGACCPIHHQHPSRKCKYQGLDKDVDSRLYSGSWERCDVSPLKGLHACTVLTSTCCIVTTSLVFSSISHHGIQFDAVHAADPAEKRGKSRHVEDQELS
jgi:hypothetical protein